MGMMRESFLRPFFLVAALLLVCTAILSILEPEPFDRYFGRYNVFFACAAAYTTGGISLAYIVSNYGFSVFSSKEGMRGIGVAGLLSLVFGIVIVSFDLLVPFPEDINVQPPISILFYPIMALVVVEHLSFDAIKPLPSGFVSLHQ